MILSTKTNFILLLIVFSVFFAGCDFSNSKQPRRTSTVNEETNTSNSDSTGNNTIILEEASNSDNSATDKTGKKSGGNSQTVVQFASGKTSRSYKNSIKDNETQTYTLKVSAGQSLTAKVSSAGNNAYFLIKTPSGNFIDNGGKGYLDILDYDLQESGNYKIVVYSQKGGADYSINISVTGGGKTTASSGGDFTKTVKFGAGKSSASYSADFNATGPDNQTYILGARSGQKMTVSVNSDVAFTIVSPSGKTLTNQTTSYSGTLPDDGNYTITINPNKARFASYKINFAVR